MICTKNKIILLFICILTVSFCHASNIMTQSSDQTKFTSEDNSEKFYFALAKDDIITLSFSEINNRLLNTYFWIERGNTLLKYEGYSNVQKQEIII